MSDNPRFIAYQVLQKYFPKKTNVSQLLNDSLKESTECREKGFVRELVWGVIRYLNTIDYYADYFLKEKKLKNPVRNILRLGIFQLIYFSQRVPAYAAVNESVELAKETGLENFAPLINAIMRKISSEVLSIEWPSKEKDPIRHFSLKYSYPEWMVTRWIKRFGAEETEKLLLAENTYPDLVLRVNTLKVSREILIDELGKEEIDARACEYSPDGIVIASNPEFDSSESYKKGHFVVQDEASQLISYLFEANKGDTILDLCSGSGIKATHLAQITGGKSRIISVDNSPRKMTDAKNNLTRLGISNIEFITEDVRKIRGIEADKILLDAPCSGLGAIRRKPDIKWNRDEHAVMKEYPALQKELLNAAAKLLKKGGTIVYCTCTIEPEENEAVIEDFLKKNKTFMLKRPGNLIVPSSLSDESGFFFKTYPQRNNMDGFFGAILRKAD